MHKSILKFFNFLKSCTQFLKILEVFSMLMMLLYWIQNLTGDFWSWSAFMNPFLDLMLEIGNYAAPGSIMLFAAVFEFKFLIAMLMFGALYALIHFCYIGICSLEEGYEQGRKIVRKFEENRFNKSLEKQSILEQKKITRYQVYVEARVKPKFAHREYNINLEEQNQILLKHLIEKTSQCPEKYEKGYLFTFESFGQIDEILDIFEKLPKSKAPLDYVICVQVIGLNSVLEREQMKTLISLETVNKITTLADTAYRYGFNDICKYETIQVGLYQKTDRTCEVHEFIRKD